MTVDLLPLVQEFGPIVGPLVLIAYLFYQEQRGSVAKMRKTLNAQGVVILTLAERNDAVDEEKVRDHLVQNGVRPEDFLKEDTREG